jgi:hypothetical protein
MHKVRYVVALRSHASVADNELFSAKVFSSEINPAIEVDRNGRSRDQEIAGQDSKNGGARSFTGGPRNTCYQLVPSTTRKYRPAGRQ